MIGNDDVGLIITFLIIFFFFFFFFLILPRLFPIFLDFLTQKGGMSLNAISFFIAHNHPCNDDNDGHDDGGNGGGDDDDRREDNDLS